MKKTFIFSAFFIFIIFSSVSFAFEPSSNTIYNGIDVSQWQRNINFSDVADDNIYIVYIKATQGNNYIDPYFEKNYANAKKNNLKIGVYHYLTARSIEEAIDEALFFSSVISKKSFDCKLAMDFESFGSLNKEEINNISETFLEKVKELTNQELIIYSDSFNSKNIFSTKLASKYPIWIAEYGVSKPAKNKNWDLWQGFQYSDKGRVKGINGYVDKDYFTKEIFLDNKTEIAKIEHKNNIDKTRFIKVKRGNTLTKLAAIYNTNIETIVDINNIKNPNLIFVGEILKIPFSNEKNIGDLKHKIYTIKKGDTLSKIALKFNVTVSELVKMNNIKDPDLIYAGKNLRI